MICMSVCLSVCVFIRELISGTARLIFTKFLCMLPMALAQSSFGGVAIRYVLPVLWVTSMSARNGESGLFIVSHFAFFIQQFRIQNAMCTV